MKAIPSVRKYMSTTPYTIGADQTVAHAQSLLRQHEIRHLPVLRGGKLDGVISERDIALVESVQGVDPHKLLVEDVMTSDVYEVSPEAPLDEVADEMATRRYGSTVIVDNHKVVGILTTVDVCRALAELLRGRLKA